MNYERSNFSKGDRYQALRDQVYMSCGHYHKTHEAARKCADKMQKIHRLFFKVVAFNRIKGEE